MTLGFLWLLLGAAGGYVVASRRPGFRVVSCVVAGMILGPLAVTLLWLPGEGRASVEGVCPYCANTIGTQARLCQHCGAILVTGW